MVRCVGKSLKYFVIAVLVLGVAGAIFGPYRIQELLRYVKSTAAENIDGMIPDEVELRNDMEKLREEYPRRIAELESMVGELNLQLDAVERDRAICREVLVLCDEDLGELKPKLESTNDAVPAYESAIEFRGASFSYPEALERSRKILDIKDMYETRMQAGTGSVGLLQAERERLTAELIGLQKEYDQFLAEYRSLAREIDLLKHNDKLIRIASRRDRLEQLDSSGWIRSLDAIKNAIERRKTEQRERLRSFRLGNPVDEYETRARIREL